MRIILPFLLAFITSISIGQVNHPLDWALGVNGASASLTINVGDTVTWTWTDSAPHDVVSKAGAAESFDSGILTGAGSSYFHVFTLPGTNDYECTIHPSSMFGTITVNPVASVNDEKTANLKAAPNPVQNELRISSDISFDRYVIHDVLGNEIEIYNKTAASNIIDFSDKRRGLYFVSVYYGQEKQVLRIIKK